MIVIQKHRSLVHSEELLLQLSCYFAVCTQMTVLICHARVMSAGKLTDNACVNVAEHAHNKRDVSKNLIPD